MQANNAPAKIPLPFANSGTKNTIPTASQIAVTPGAASLTDGFPPLTRTPIAAGGVPPFGADMNGILFEISANTQWENAGGFYPYDATFSTAIGGYPKGAVLAKVANNGLWMSTVDNNTSNPDTGGAGWVDTLTGRLLNTQIFATSGTYTPTAGTTKCRVTCIGGGGSGGGAAATGASQGSVGGGGGAGNYQQATFAVAAVTGQTVTVGAGGATSSAAGNPGGTSSIGSAITATGGGGGGVGLAVALPVCAAGGSGATSGTGGQIGGAGGSGGLGVLLAAGNGQGGTGGSSALSGGGPGPTSSGNGNQGAAAGAGGSGAMNSLPSLGAKSSGSGAAGIVIIEEFA